jgi:hypothetical protein
MVHDGRRGTITVYYSILFRYDVKLPYKTNSDEWRVMDNQV